MSDKTLNDTVDALHAAIETYNLQLRADDRRVGSQLWAGAVHDMIAAQNNLIGSLVAEVRRLQRAREAEQPARGIILRDGEVR